MFTLVEMKDAIPVPASELDKPRPVAVGNQIEQKYCNRVLLDVGLCISLYELTEIGDGLIYQSDSAVHIRVRFTLLVFRPFIGEVLVGTIYKSTPHGLWLSVGFFNDIFIPPHFMLDGSEWDADQRLWVWKSQHGDAALDPELGSQVRFRVTNSVFRHVERPSKAPPAAAAAVAAAAVPGAEKTAAAMEGVDGEEEEEPQPVFQVMASIKDDGLGLVVWWE
mmetsp:Transcript_41426/g.84697  ORF Transcript_41426/g.84697 Transcript_41426/m.84697 type:complete len:221 (+) Transcript_41426:290-952(+)